MGRGGEGKQPLMSIDIGRQKPERTLEQGAGWLRPGMWTWEAVSTDGTEGGGHGQLGPRLALRLGSFPLPPSCTRSQWQQVVLGPQHPPLHRCCLAAPDTVIAIKIVA